MSTNRKRRNTNQKNSLSCPVPCGWLIGPRNHLPAWFAVLCLLLCSSFQFSFIVCLSLRNTHRATHKSKLAILKISLVVAFYIPKWKVKVLVAQSCLTLLSHGLLCPCDSPARTLEWVAMPSSRGSSQPSDRTQVSYTAGGCFTIWATREILECCTWPYSIF